MRWHFFCLIFHSVIHTDCEKVWLIFIPFFSLTDVLSSEIGGVNKHGKLGVSSAKCYICKCVRTLRGKQTNGKRTRSLIPQWTEITLKGDNRDLTFFKLFQKHRLQILEKYSANSLIFYILYVQMMNDFSQLFLSVHVQLQQSHKVQHFNMRMEQKDLKCCQLTLCPTCHPKIAKVTQNSPTAAAAFSKLTAAFHCQEGNVN